MEIQGFIENFAAQFEETNKEDFCIDTVFHNLDEYSSLIALSIIAMIDEEYDVTLTGSEMRMANTIGDLFLIVQNKLK